MCHILSRHHPRKRMIQYFEALEISSAAEIAGYSAGACHPARRTRTGLQNAKDSYRHVMPVRGIGHRPQMSYISAMTTAEDIRKAVEQLAPRELARFRAWFEAFDAAQFDAAIERDARAGKLDAHADEALAAHRAGRSREV
jgi:hypothetical protein